MNARISEPAADTAWPADSFLGLLSEPERADFLRMGRTKRHVQQESLMRQGEDSRFVVLILSGVVQTYVNTENGRLRVLSFHGRGELLGEMAYFSQAAPRSATAVALAPVIARHLSAADFTRFLDLHPRATHTVAGTISDRLRLANERREEYLGVAANGRIAHVIADIAVRLGRPGPHGLVLGQAFTQADLASLASVSPKTMEKSLRTMQEAGLIQRRRRELVIRDLQGLNAFARAESDRFPA